MKNNFLLVVVLFTFLLSCNKDDDSTNNDDVPVGAQSLVIIKDGVTFNAENINNTLISSDQGLTQRRLDLRGDIDGGTFILNVSNLGSQNPPENGIVVKSYDTNADFGRAIPTPPNSVCTVIDSETICDEALVSFVLGNKTFISEIRDSVEFGIITITNNDVSNQTVSGTFNVKLQEFASPSTDIIEYTGTFTNMKYELF